MPNECRVAAGVVVAALTVIPQAGAVEDWSRFRGPNGSGHPAPTAAPVELGPEARATWSVDVPFGRSSPVVSGDRVFLTAAEADRFLTLAIDLRTGATLWRAEAARSRTDDMYHDQDSASPSAATDGDNVYVFFQETGLISYDAEGGERWRLPLGPFRNYYGLAASPVLAGSRLFLVCDQAVGSFLIAVDKDTGEVLWRRERPGRVESYTTPLLYPDAERPAMLIVYGSQWLDAYDLASGETLWSVPGLAAGPVASPVLSGDRIFVSGPDHASEPMTPFEQVAAERDGDGDGVLTREEVAETWMFNHFGFLDVDGSGALTPEDWAGLDEVMTAEGWGVFGLRFPVGGGAPEIAWNHRQNVPYIPTPVAVGDVLFTVEDGIVSSLDAASGELLHRGRLTGGSAKVYASPVADGDRVYFATLDGDLVVVSAEPEWEVLAVHGFDEPIYATPAVAGGRLLVRTRGGLHAFASGDSSEHDEPRDKP